VFGDPPVSILWPKGGGVSRRVTLAESRMYAIVDDAPNAYPSDTFVHTSSERRRAHDLTHSSNRVIKLIHLKHDD
jgi:hypothetical protein